MALDFTGKPSEKKYWERTPLENCLKWLHETYLCDESVDPYVQRIFSEFNNSEAWDRAKAIPLCAGKIAEDVTYEQVIGLGLFDHTIGYHVLWDRCWAVRNGIDPDKAAGIESWDYAKKKPIWGCILEEHECFFKPCTSVNEVRCCRACGNYDGGCSAPCYVAKPREEGELYQPKTRMRDDA